MEKQPMFEVICKAHGNLGLVASAHLGIALFEAHRLEQTTECGGVEIHPKMDLKPDKKSVSLNKGGDTM